MRGLVFLMLLLATLQGCTPQPLPAHEHTASPSMHKRALLSSLTRLIRPANHIYIPVRNGGYVAVKGIFREGPLRWHSQSKAFLDGMKTLDADDKAKLAYAYDLDPPAARSAVHEEKDKLDGVWRRIKHTVDAPPTSAETLEHMSLLLAQRKGNPVLTRQVRSKINKAQRLATMTDSYMAALVRAGHDASDNLARMEREQYKAIAYAHGTSIPDSLPSSAGSVSGPFRPSLKKQATKPAERKTLTWAPDVPVKPTAKDKGKQIAVDDSPSTSGTSDTSSASNDSPGSSTYEPKTPNEDVFHDAHDTFSPSDQPDKPASWGETLKSYIPISSWRPWAAKTPSAQAAERPGSPRAVTPPASPPRVVPQTLFPAKPNEIGSASSEEVVGSKQRTIAGNLTPLVISHQNQW